MPTLLQQPQSQQDTLPVSPACACPQCKTPLTLVASHHALRCNTCNWSYPCKSINGRLQPDFRPDAGKLPAAALDETESFQNKIKLFLRRYPGFYRFLVYTIGPALLLGPTSQKFVSNLGPGKSVLNIGAGVMRLKGNVTHLDYEPYEHLEIVGDAHQLPYADNTFDGVICETLLEHVREPWQVIAEMHRVLKPGGKIYVMMPFIFSFHAAPNDFYRFTHRGFEYQMRDFTQDQLKVISGPASALTSVLVEFLSIAFSFGSKRLYRLLSLGFLVLLAPLKLMDFLLCLHPEAVRIASVLLFIGSKK